MDAAQRVFSFIQISDPHILEVENGELHGFTPGLALRKVLAHIAAHQAGRFDFLAITGDIVNTPDPAAYQTFKRLLGLSDQLAAFPGPLRASIGESQPVPVYCLPGNHDDHDLFYQQLFPHTPAGQLANAVSEHRGVRLIFLDFGSGERPHVPAESMEFLARALDTGRPTLLLTHHNVAPIGSRWLDKYIAADIQRFWSVLQGRRVLGIFCGHTHATYAVTHQGIPVFGVRSTAIPFAVQDEHIRPLLPPHYRRVTLNGDRLTSEIFEVEL